MDTETQDRLKRVEEKLDAVIAKIDQAERLFGHFMLGPGKKLGKLLGISLEPGNHQGG